MEINIFWSDKIKRTKPDDKQFLKFVQEMAFRLMQGFCRYGEAKKEQMYMTRMTMEMKHYKRTGNMESLFNIANYCLLESITPENKKFHWDAKVESVTRNKIKIPQNDL